MAHGVGPTFIECVFSESAFSSCPYYDSSWRYLLWTAGYRSTTDSTFVWRVTSSDTNSDVVSPMNYTNWEPGQPNNSGNVCMVLGSGKSYAWGDHFCSTQWCPVCELDL